MFFLRKGFKNLSFDITKGLTTFVLCRTCFCNGVSFIVNHIVNFLR